VRHAVIAVVPRPFSAGPEETDLAGSAGRDPLQAVRRLFNAVPGSDDRDGPWRNLPLQNAASALLLCGDATSIDRPPRSGVRLRVAGSIAGR
jgi:hypothetical protein